MITVCVVTPDGMIFTIDLGDKSPGADMRGLQASFGKNLVFGGHPVTDQRVEWLEASGDDLEFFDDLMVGLPMPRVVMGTPRMGAMRWYGDQARTILGAWVATVLADGLARDAGEGPQGAD